MSAEYNAASHVIDSNALHLPFNVTIHLPSVNVPVCDCLQPYLGDHLQFGSKYMWLELVAFLLCCVVFIPLARKIRSGAPVKGRIANLLEAMVMFVRNDIAIPNIGKSHANAYLPYLLSVFFFILFCNLLGLIPWLGSATGAWATTLVLAISTFIVVNTAGMKEKGVFGYWAKLCPKMDVHWSLAIVLVPMLWCLEFISLIIKHFVLSVRLLANMFAGHLVLAVILGFILLTAGKPIWYAVMPASVLGSVCLNLLELFVAFLQAYIFTFLSALFIGMAMHEH